MLEYWYIERSLLCQIESENKILHKFIDMTSADDLIPKQKTSMVS